VTADRVRKLGQSSFGDELGDLYYLGDWGGWYDHVDPPPLKEKMDGRESGRKTELCKYQFSLGRASGAGDRPYSKRGFRRRFIRM